MRVFVFGSGRCGSVSFAESCKYMTNYTCAHESINYDLEYPDNHIEVNPQFRVIIPELMSKYLDAKFVWLTRNPEKVTASIRVLDKGRWLRDWWVFYNTLKPTNLDEAARITTRCLLHTCSIVFQQIPESQKKLLMIEKIQHQLKDFWDWIDAEGDFELAKESFNKPKNTSEQRGDR